MGRSRLLLAVPSYRCARIYIRRKSESNLVYRSVVAVCMSTFDHLNAVLLNVVKVVGCKCDFVGKDAKGMEIFLLRFLKLG